MKEYQFTVADLLKYWNTEQEILEEVSYQGTYFEDAQSGDKYLIIHSSEVEIKGYDKETDTYFSKQGVIDVDSIFLVIPEKDFTDGDPSHLTVPNDPDLNYHNLWSYHIVPTFTEADLINISDLETFFTKPDTERPTLDLFINTFNKTPERAKELMELHEWLFTSNSIKVNAFFDKEIQSKHKEWILIENVNWVTELVKLQGIEEPISIDALLDYALA